MNIFKSKNLPKIMKSYNKIASPKSPKSYKNHESQFKRMKSQVKISRSSYKSYPFNPLSLDKCNANNSPCNCLNTWKLNPLKKRSWRSRKESSYQRNDSLYPKINMPLLYNINEIYYNINVMSTKLIIFNGMGSSLDWSL